MLKKLKDKIINRETVLYVVTGVLTTLLDWISYTMMRRSGVGYRFATIGSWVVAVLFAYVANKFFVFRSMSLRLRGLWREFSSFVACRLATGLFTLVAMMVMVDGLGIQQDFICKVATSAISLVLNYLFSKWFIFRKTTGLGQKRH